MMEQVWSYLHTEDAAEAAGYALGIVTFFQIDYPLSSLFHGAIAGFCCTFGATLVHSMLPHSLQPVVPLACHMYLLRNFYLRWKYQYLCPIKPFIAVTYNTSNQE